VLTKLLFNVRWRQKTSAKQKRTFSWWRNEVLYGGLIVIRALLLFGCGEKMVFLEPDWHFLIWSTRIYNGQRNSALLLFLLRWWCNSTFKQRYYVFNWCYKMYIKPEATDWNWLTWEDEPHLFTLVT
jgi:hypothetical protein